jgi:hypothetical protein
VTAPAALAAPTLVPAPAALTVPTVTIGRKTYRLLDAVDNGEFKEETRRPMVTISGIDDDDTFTGTDRLTPKTTIVDARTDQFASVAALVGQLQPDSDMAQMDITRSTDTRVDAEKRNVHVKGFIHAFKKEGDNDYHVILGDGPDANNGVFLNVEVSGIPVGGTNANRNRLIQVRELFKNTLHLGATGPNGYKRPHEPIPVEITGSLFWDVDHKPGKVGPSDMAPKTSWEIHPVSEIKFLDN